MEKINWKVYAIAGGNYSKSVYSWHKLKIKGGFFVSKRLYKKLDKVIRRIVNIKEYLDKHA